MVRVRIVSKSLRPLPPLNKFKGLSLCFFLKQALRVKIPKLEIRPIEKNPNDTKPIEKIPWETFPMEKTP